MKLYLFTLVFIISSFGSTAQSTKGITNKRDTSYSNYTAFQQMLKSHPDASISLVKEYKPSNISEKRDITYCKIGERALQLDAFFPIEKSKKPRPAIMIIHGGGWRTGNRTQHIPMAQKLASLGYVTFTAEYRLSTEALFPAAVHDLKSALRWIRANAKAYNIDVNQVATIGFSAGGQLSALLGNTNGIEKFEGKNCHLKTSSDVNAIVDIDGILAFIHPESGEGDDSRSTSAATYWFGYSKTENPDLWKEGSALTHVSPKTPPTLFINSAVERMHAGRDDYQKKLHEWGIYSETHTFPNSPHSFILVNPWFEPSIQYIDEFLRKLFKLSSR